MAIGMDIASITRVQDYTTIKHNEDQKPVIDQGNILRQVQKDAEEAPRQVRSSDNAQMHLGGRDARDKGSNEYSGDGGRHRRRNSDTGQVVVNGHTGFDMKI